MVVATYFLISLLVSIVILTFAFFNLIIMIAVPLNNGWFKTTFSIVINTIYNTIAAKYPHRLVAKLTLMSQHFTVLS